MAFEIGPYPGDAQSPAPRCGAEFGEEVGAAVEPDHVQAALRRGERVATAAAGEVDQRSVAGGGGELVEPGNEKGGGRRQ